MSFTVETIFIESVFGVSIRNKLLVNSTPTGKLLAMLPGRGYTNDHPVMHYVMTAALARGYDVLRVEYGFQVAQVSQASIAPDKLPQMMEESKSALEQALARGGYTHLCIAAKSMGTPMAVYMLPELKVEQKSLLLLTPVQNAAEMTGGVRTLAVIGTDDPSYHPSQIRNSETLTWRVFEGLNHGLENEDDWHASLAVLPEIINACDAFLAV